MNLTASRAAGDVPGVYVGPGTCAVVAEAATLAKAETVSDHRTADAFVGRRRPSLHPARRVLSDRHVPSLAVTSSLATAEHVVHIALDRSETHPHG